MCTGQILITMPQSNLHHNYTKPIALYTTSTLPKRYLSCIDSFTNTIPLVILIAQFESRCCYLITLVASFISQHRYHSHIMRFFHLILPALALSASLPEV